jgi:hypothetical protein
MGGGGEGVKAHFDHVLCCMAVDEWGHSGRAAGSPFARHVLPAAGEARSSSYRGGGGGGGH